MVFPKHVYKAGTGKADESGCFTAESILVHSAEELKALGGEWVDSPAAAAKSAVVPKKEVEAIAKQDAAVIAELTEDIEKTAESKHHKKAK